MLKALKPANAGDLWKGDQNRKIHIYLKCSLTTDSDKYVFTAIGACFSYLGNEGVFQKSVGQKVSIYCKKPIDI